MFIHSCLRPLQLPCLAVVLCGAACAATAQPGKDSNPCGKSDDSSAVFPQISLLEFAFPPVQTSGLYRTEDGLIVYDATYLELALRRDLPLVSRDGALTKAALKEGIRVLKSAARRLTLTWLGQPQVPLR